MASSSIGLGNIFVTMNRAGDELIILLRGGTKKRQHEEIETAKALWQNYKGRRNQDV